MLFPYVQINARQRRTAMTKGAQKNQTSPQLCQWGPQLCQWDPQKSSWKSKDSWMQNPREVAVFDDHVGTVVNGGGGSAHKW